MDGRGRLLLPHVHSRCLLDLTDNYDARRWCATGTPRYDGDDPYLVWRPNKGTANVQRPRERDRHDYGFWLGDAFASGGSRL